MFRKLMCSSYILLVIVVTSCNYIPQSDYNSLLIEYEEVVKEKLVFEQKCDNLTQEIRYTEQELNATREELINIKAQLEEIKLTLQDEKSKESHVLMPSATLPDEMILAPYGKRIWEHINDYRQYGNLGNEIRLYEEGESIKAFPPYYAMEMLDGTLAHIPRQEAWELYKIMENLEYQDNSLFVKLVQLGCIPR